MFEFHRLYKILTKKKIIFMSDSYPSFASLFEPATKANTERSL